MAACCTSHHKASSLESLVEQFPSETIVVRVRDRGTPNAFVLGIGGQVLTTYVGTPTTRMAKKSPQDTTVDITGGNIAGRIPFRRLTMTWAQMHIYTIMGECKPADLYMLELGGGI